MKSFLLFDRTLKACDSTDFVANRYSIDANLIVQATATPAWPLVPIPGDGATSFARRSPRALDAHSPELLRTAKVPCSILDEYPDRPRQLSRDSRSAEGAGTGRDGVTGAVSVYDTCDLSRIPEEKVKPPRNQFRAQQTARIP